MLQEHQIISQVYNAKNDMSKMDSLIREYIPFIKKEVSKFMNQVCSEQSDEYSIGLMAFHEAALGYEKRRGAFLSYAAMTIKSRLIDYQRKQTRHQGHIYLDEPQGEDKYSMSEMLPDTKDSFSELENVEATRQEIDDLADVIKAFGISFTDVANNAPKQERTFEACAKAVRCAVENPQILDELLSTKKLPMQMLTRFSGVERKTLERHRKYVLAMLLVQTNGFEIIRGHIRNMIKVKGELPA